MPQEKHLLLLRVQEHLAGHLTEVIISMELILR